MPVSGHRPYAHHTPLGERMWELGLRVKNVTMATSINSRTLSDYLADRRPISAAHLRTLAAYLDVEPDELVPAPDDDAPIRVVNIPAEPEPLRVKQVTAGTRVRKVTPHV